MKSASNLLTITPPETLPWLSAEQKRQSIILLDVEADFAEGMAFRVDLNVVFNPIAITRTGVIQADFYVGSTGAEIILQFDDSYIRRYTEDMTIPTEYAISNKRSRVSGLKLSPGVGSGGDEGEQIKLGDISLKRGNERNFEVRFASAERVLASANMGNLVKWMLNLPRAELLVRDFLLGNLHLFGECELATERICGTVSVRPSDVLFFDKDRRVLSKIKSIIMLYELWRRSLTIRNRNGVSIRFVGIRSND